jgi:AraC family transcriptional regulator
MTRPDLGVAQAVARARGAAARTVTASGRIYFWHNGSLWIGQGRGRSDRHEHHAHQIALALDGELRFRAERDQGWTPFEAAFVPSHCPHEFEIDGARVAHLFVEPESSEGRSLAACFGAGAIVALPQASARRSVERLFEAFLGHADAAAMRGLARAAVALLAGAADGMVPASRPVDQRIARALEHLRSRLREPLSLAQAASAAALSPSRFRHLFVQETGTSFRAYLLWLRINVAIEAAMAGASWTEAAHEAGFADSSHLTRTHRRMFGIEPTAVRPD